jgi:polyisoprenyl-teichoic acid--peptidoglycan teichoic acid transferase
VRGVRATFPRQKGAPVTSPTLPHAQLRSHRIKLRRGLVFLLMTLVLPGSAQLSAGNKRIGRLALRVWAVVVGTLLITAVVALVRRAAVVTLLASPVPLHLLQIGLISIGLAWALLLVDAWRISRPPELARRHRLGFAALSLALTFVVTGSMFASASIVSAQRDFMASVFAGGGDRDASGGRINILLLGGDADDHRVGLRPDSITVASIETDTGRTALFSLPRNMEDVPFPEYSPLHEKFPDGYGCADHTCMLNAIYQYATQHPDLYPGVRDPGAQATKEAAEGVTGLKINYYAMVDLEGFEKLIDAVGGITLDVNKRLPIGGQHPGSKVQNYIEPGQNKHLDGFHALWYARSRHADSDYARMARQKCVMAAMLDQLDPFTVLTKFNRIAAAGKEIVATDVPPSEVNRLIDLAGRAKDLPITSVSFVPPLIYPGSPDFALIRRTVGHTTFEASQQGVAQAAAERAARKRAREAAGAEAASGSKSRPQKSGSTSSGGSGTADLGAECSA